MSGNDPLTTRRARRISRQESHLDSTLKRYREYFLELSMNAEGKVYYDQLDAIISRLDLDMNVDDLKKALEWVEKDSCGMISFKMFFDVFSSIRAQNHNHQNNNNTVDPSIPNYPRVMPFRAGGPRSRKNSSENPPILNHLSQYKQNRRDIAMDNIDGFLKGVRVNEAAEKGGSDEESDTGSTGSVKRMESSETGSIASNGSSDSFVRSETTNMNLQNLRHQYPHRHDIVSKDKEFHPKVEPTEKPVSAMAQKKNSVPKRRVSIAEDQQVGRKTSKESSKEDKEQGQRPLRKSLTGKEVTDGCKYFWENDKDCDGKLSMREFTNMIDALGIGLNKGRVRQAFKQADLDGDGFIEFEEYVRVYLNKIKSQTLTCDEIKEIFDANNQTRRGYLNKEELGQTLRMLGNEHMEDEDLDRFMAVIDKRHDGKITFKDLCEFLGFED